MPSEARVLTIGHSNHGWERFAELLRGAGVTAVADVHTSPWSRHTPQFNRETLAASLKAERVAYVFLGAELGGRPAGAHLFYDGVADYKAMAREAGFQAALERVVAVAKMHVVALMCAEREPLDCHRCLLVSRRLRDLGVGVAHIHADGAIEPHDAAEQRLLVCEGLDQEDIFENRESRLDRAYQQRARKVAYAQAAAEAAPNAAAG